MAQTVSYNDFLSIIDKNVSRYLDCNYKPINRLDTNKIRKYYSILQSCDFIPISDNIIAYVHDLYNKDYISTTQYYKMFIIKKKEYYILELYQFTERHDDSIVCINILNKQCKCIDDIISLIKSITYIDSTNIIKNIENIKLF
jgi:hypothetical protein